MEKISVKKMAIGSLSAIFLGASTFGYLSTKNLDLETSERVIAALAIGGGTTAGAAAGVALLGANALGIALGTAIAYPASEELIQEYLGPPRKPKKEIAPAN